MICDSVCDMSSPREASASKNVLNVSVQEICHYFVHKYAFSRVSVYSYTVFRLQIHLKKSTQIQGHASSAGPVLPSTTIILNNGTSKLELCQVTKDLV